MNIVKLILFLFAIILIYSFTLRKSNSNLTKELLGEKLFNEKLLSSDRSISCASCHKPEFAFSDTLDFSLGVGGKKTARNVPTAMNMSARTLFFFDGRAASLEEQALGPIQNPDEMNLNIDSAINRLNANKSYRADFIKLYNSIANRQNLGDAIASFERTLETSNSEYDLFIKNKKNGFSSSALRGKNIFIGKGKCFDCHSGTDFTNDEFRNIGLYNGSNMADKGRFEITKNEKDIGSFKVPGLRNIEITAPYMHNGIFKTLEEVVTYYNNPNEIVSNSINRDSVVTKLNLTKEEQIDLVAFLKSLTDRRFKKTK